MKKKKYMIPQVEVYKMEMQKTLAVSQIQSAVNNPDNEVDAGNALSRDTWWDY